MVNLYPHFHLKPVTSDFTALQPHPSLSVQTEAPAAPCSSSVYNPGSISTPSTIPITRLHTHCQLQAEFFSSAPIHACPGAYTESAQQCERGSSLSAWRLRTLGCVLSSLWMCGIRDMARSDGFIVRAQSIPCRMALNNRKWTGKKCTQVQYLSWQLQWQRWRMSPSSHHSWCFSRAIWFSYLVPIWLQGEMCRDRAYSKI